MESTLFAGNSNINEAQTFPEAVAAKVNGIHMIVVSVGQQVNTLELKAIASDPDERNIFQVERISQLPDLVSRIPNALCNGEKCLIPTLYRQLTLYPNAVI